MDSGNKISAIHKTISDVPGALNWIADKVKQIHIPSQHTLVWELFIGKFVKGYLQFLPLHFLKEVERTFSLSLKHCLEIHLTFNIP